MKRFFLAILLITNSPVTAQEPLHAIRTIMEVSYINSNQGLGWQMLALGDINGDGKPDFAVSAFNTERTFIYFGGKGVLDDVPDVVIVGGGKMAMGDLNGDGKKDLLVATPESLLVYFGKATSPSSPLAIDTIPGLVITGEGILDFNDNSFAIGDLNHDGYDDLVITDRSYGPRQGRVYVYLGRPHPISTPDFSALGDSARSEYGYRASIADINGDGISDLVISTNDERGFQTIDIYYGRAGWTYTKNGYDQRIDSREGNWNALAAFNLVDANADGKADIAFGYSNLTYFICGRSDSVSHTPDLVLTNPESYILGAYQFQAVNIGDINGDGKNDFALLTNLGVGGCLVVYLGGPTPEPVAARCLSFVISSSCAIAQLGDINGDGINDFGFGAPFNVLGVPPQDGGFVILSGDTTLVTSVRHDLPLPIEVALSQNFPNPFNPSTTIRYSLPHRSDVSLVVYNMLGQQVAILAQGEEDAGFHEAQFDGSGLASGVYYYRLQMSGQSVTKRLLLIR
jgi:hypothetical protein